MPGRGRELFVWWRTAQSAAPEALAAVSALQRDLQRAHLGLSARLYQRTEQALSVTVMEAYAHPPDGMSDTLIDAISRLGQDRLQAWCSSGRHLEVFEPWPASTT